MLQPAPAENFYPVGRGSVPESPGSGAAEMPRPLEVLVGVTENEDIHVAFAEQYEEGHTWPMLGDIHFNEKALFGGGLPTTPESRVRAVLRGTVEAAEKWHNENSEDILPTLDIDPLTVSARLRQVETHFKKQREVGDLTKPIGYFVQFAEIKAELMHLLEKRNHPLYQALGQVRVDNARRQVHAASLSAGPLVLSQIELEQLEDNILKFTFVDDITVYCDLRIKSLRRALREKDTQPQP